MTPEEQAIVNRAAASMCDMCANPAKWLPAVCDEQGDWYHERQDGKGEEAWCDSNMIWGEFTDDALTRAMRRSTSESMLTLPLFSVGEQAEPA